MDISKNIIDIRERKKIKQSEIADKLEIEQPNYSRLEKRGDKLTVEQLKKIADALGVTVFELLGNDAPQHDESEKIKALKDTVEQLQENVDLYKNVIKSLLETTKKFDDVMARVDKALGIETKIKNKVV